LFVIPQRSGGTCCCGLRRRPIAVISAGVEKPAFYQYFPAGKIIFLQKQPKNRMSSPETA
jgi:hypothetical protein